MDVAFDAEFKFVKVRRFRGPRLHVREPDAVQPDGLPFARFEAERQGEPVGGFPVRAVQDAVQAAVLVDRAVVPEHDLGVEHARFVVGLVEQGADGEVADGDVRRAEEHDVAEDAGEAEVILVLKVGAVAEMVHLDRDRVLSRLQILRDVELVRAERILRVAGLFAVDPQVERRRHAVQPHEDPAFLEPVLRQVEFAHVGADRVAFQERRLFARGLLRHERRIDLERVFPAGIERRAVALNFPRGRHGDRVPVRDVVVRHEEVGGARLRREGEMELPVAVQEHKVFFVRRDGAVRAHRLGVHVVDALVFPFADFGVRGAEALCGNGGGEQSGRGGDKAFVHDRDSSLSAEKITPFEKKRAVIAALNFKYI